MMEIFTLKFIALVVFEILLCKEKYAHPMNVQ